VGLFLAMTGHRMNATDLIDVGLADLQVPSHKREALLEIYCDFLRDSDRESFVRKAASLGQGTERPQSVLKPEFQTFQELELSAKLLDLRMKIQRLSELGAFQHSAETFAKGSPLSAAVSVEQLRRGKSLSLPECFRMEFHLACRFALGPDFREGIRALLIDKDQKPKWSVPSLEELTPGMVSKMFEKVSGKELLL
jgi:enoyl-CoA hydratase/carnithine racemase